MKPREGQKRAIFPSLIRRGGRGGEGGLGFPFTLPKIVGYVHEITLCGHHKVSKGGLRYGNKCLPLWYVNVVVATIFDFTTEEEMATSH